MDTRKIIQNASLEQLIRWWNGEEIPDWAAGSVLIREKIAPALRSSAEGIAFLKSRTRSKDVKEKQRALLFLSHKEVYDDEVKRLLADTFRNADNFETQLALAFKGFVLDCFVALDQYPFERYEVKPLLVCELKGTAASAMVYLSHAYPEEAVAILRAGLRSDNDYMQANACTEAGFRNIRELREEVAELRKSESWYIANSAKIGCEMFDLFEWERHRHRT